MFEAGKKTGYAAVGRVDDVYGDEVDVGDVNSVGRYKGLAIWLVTVPLTAGVFGFESAGAGRFVVKLMGELRAEDTVCVVVEGCAASSSDVLTAVVLGVARNPG